MQISRALITGASSGIGEEFARQLAARGVALVVVARREDRLEALAAELARRHGREVEVVPADLSDASGSARVEQRLRDTAKPVDLLVNNAGFGLYGAFADLPGERQAEMVALNAGAVVRLTHALLPGVLARGQGGVINVASTAAFQPDPYGAVYGASKAFVRSFTEALHEELSATRVRAMVLCPGFTTTEFQDVADVRLGRLPDRTVTTAEPVVRTALRDFARGRAVCVPGAANKLATAASDLSPSLVSRRASALVHRRFAAD